MKIYITVCHDRHAEDDIKAHRTLARARKYIKNWIKNYTEHDYRWTEEVDYTDDDWVCTFDSGCDDGPSAHIEASKLEK